MSARTGADWLDAGTKPLRGRSRAERSLPPDGIVVEARADGEQRTERIEARARLEREREPVVGVADHRHVARRVRDRVDELDHPLDQGPVVALDLDAEAACGEPGNDEKRSDELLIRRRLLLVHAVGIDLAANLPLEAVERVPPPRRGDRPARTRAARDEHAAELADQV